MGSSRKVGRSWVTQVKGLVAGTWGRGRTGLQYLFAQGSAASDQSLEERIPSTQMTIAWHFLSFIKSKLLRILTVDQNYNVPVKKK